MIKEKGGPVDPTWRKGERVRQAGSEKGYPDRRREGGSIVGRGGRKTLAVRRSISAFRCPQEEDSLRRREGPRGMGRGDRIGKGDLRHNLSEILRKRPSVVERATIPYGPEPTVESEDREDSIQTKGGEKKVAKRRT